MNKLKTFKYKTSGKNDSGIFNKISKRYSSVNFLRSRPGRKSSPQPISTGSYDMTGNESEDLKREIGAPILISKTTIDSDTSTDCVRVRSVDSPIEENSKDSSENEVFHDTVTNFNEIKFSFLPTDETENRLSTNSEYDSPRPQPPMVLRKNKSKSATNLHKSEIKVFLHKAPSLELDTNVVTENCYDLPRNLHFVDEQDSSGEEQATGQKISTNAETSKNSAENLSMIYVSKNDLNSRNEKSTSRESFGFNSSCDEDFDLKSASFQSLEARNLFLSIEELNEITRQINESEEFSQEVDLEYCEHRDKLRPDERRITLLRNKNHNGIGLASKREKLSNAWTGLKHWIGEEKVKIKDVVHKHASMQRVGGPSNSNSKISIVRNQDFFDKVRRTSVAHSSSQQRGASNAEESPSSSPHTKQHQQHSNKQWEGEGTDIESDELSLNSEKFKNGEANNLERHSSKTRSRIFGSEDKDNLPAFFQSIVTKKSSKADESVEGQNGFEELRRYLKQGGDFGKDLVAILQERVDSEQLYSKSLSKMASKLSKACREIPGSLADAWRGVATEMESRSEVHRQFSHSMVEEIVKPLKVILDNHHKTRKSIESTVDKSARILSEWRATEAKAKKSSHTAARENEKLQDAMLDVRIQRSPSVALLHHNNHKTPEKEIKNAEKDCAKLDNKRRKAEDLVKRADVEYYTLCIRAERARVEWEMSVLRGSTILQNHENQRLTCLKNYVADYLKFSNLMNPSLNQIVDRLAPVIHACNVQKDLTVVKNIRRSSEGPSEQLLPDFYCEHTTLAMNRERRKHALVKLLQLVRTDLERERKSRNGLKELSNSMNTPENQNIADKLYHIRSMLTYLEGARFKLQSALLELDHKPRGSHPLGPHIQITRDRTGLQQSILKVPLWLKNGDETDRMSQEQFAENELEIVDGGTEHCVDSRNETLIKHFDRNFNRSKSSVEFNKQNVVVTNNQERNGSSSPVFDRGIADGGSNQPDSDFDEFSSQDEDDELSKKQTIPRMLSTQQPTIISRCKALYNYSPKLYDELELNPGDLIDVHAKQEDGWWLGALKNKVGIFPATYVEEMA